MKMKCGQGGELELVTRLTLLDLVAPTQLLRCVAKQGARPVAPVSDKLGVTAPHVRAKAGLKWKSLLNYSLPLMLKAAHAGEIRGHGRGYGESPAKLGCGFPAVLRGEIG